MYICLTHLVNLITQMPVFVLSFFLLMQLRNQQSVTFLCELRCRKCVVMFFFPVPVVKVWLNEGLDEAAVGKTIFHSRLLPVEPHFRVIRWGQPETRFYTRFDVSIKSNTEFSRCSCHGLVRSSSRVNSIFSRLPHPAIEIRALRVICHLFAWF